MSYFIRFTPHKPGIYTLGTVAFVIESFEPSKYVVGKEQAASEHFHIAIWGVGRTTEDLRYHLKKKLDGQVYISGKEIIDKIKAIAYCLKDGNYKTYNLDVTEFLQAASVSKPKIKYDDLLKAAEDGYDGDDRKFLGQLIDAHIKTNKKPYMQHLKAQLLLTKLKKEKFGTYRSYLMDKIVDEL